MEAALVATIGRGCKAFRAGGEVHASAMSDGMGRPLDGEYEIANGQDLSILLFVPWVIVGPAGNGTVYATQMEALRLTGCAGPGRKWALVGTVAAFALVADVSVAASVASSIKASGHYKLAREVQL